MMCVIIKSRSFIEFLLFIFRSIPIDYNLYKKFWSLQDYFRKPNQCYDKTAWKVFANVSINDCHDR